MANTFGKLFTVTSFGESHGRCIGAVVDGCPAGLPLEEGDIQADLDRRRPGAGPASTTRSEADRVEILSGTYEGRTTGAPICMLVWNSDTDSTWYLQNRFRPRPGHADLAAYVKYGGFNDPRGGGRFSGRITATFVMAGAIARKLLLLKEIEVLAHTVAIGGIRAASRESQPARGAVEGDPLRCADTAASALMLAAIEEARTAGDSLGGIIEGIALNVPTGLGEPVFDTLEGDLSKAMFAIPAVKAVEFGSGFASAEKRGSENNDAFGMDEGRVVARSNNAGGILGGISSGMPVVLRVAVKPTPSISLEQETVDLERNEPAALSTRGRHDVCIVPRAVPVVEAMMAITLCDFALRARVIPEVLA